MPISAQTVVLDVVCRMCANKIKLSIPPNTKYPAPESGKTITFFCSQACKSAWDNWVYIGAELLP